MKKVFRFNKMYIPFVIMSVLLIAGGIFGYCTIGINYGIDFKPGLIQEVRIAPSAIFLTYEGNTAVSVQASTAGVAVVVSGIGSDNTTYNFYYGQYPTVAELVSALNTVEGVTAVANVSGSLPSAGMFTASDISNVLSDRPYALYRSYEELATIDDVRVALASIPEADVKESGNGLEKGFQVRIGDDGSDKDVSSKNKALINNALTRAFDKDNVVVVKTDFIGATLSASLVRNTAYLVLGTLFLIWIYAAFRFKWDFALGAVIAIIHDALIMVTFVVWTQMEFTSLSIAAILTVVGYSINDTVVVLDRVRENVRLGRSKIFKEILNISLSECLSRTLITTITTLLAIISLYVFTTGQMKDFALLLIVGMISGVYSTIYIASAFIALCRKNWKPSDEKQKTPAVAAY